jgi:CHAT domain-containing protein
LALLILLVAPGCQREPRQSNDVLYKSAELSFERGETRISLDRAEAGLLQCGSSAEWCWKFNLLKAESWMALGQTKQALGLLEKAGASSNAEIEARRRMDQGWATYSISEVPRASKLLGEAHDLAKASGSPVILSEVELRQAPLLQLEKKFDEADATLRHALQLAVQAGDPYVEALVTGNLGFLFETSLFRYDDAIYWFSRSLALSEHIGASALTAQTVENLATCYYRLGDLDKALASFAEAETRFAKLGNERAQERWLGSSGSILLDREDFPAAIDRLKRALDMARRIDDQRQRLNWLINLAWANAAIGQLDTAEAYNKDGLALAKANGDERQELYLRLNSAKIAAKRKHLRDAEALYQSVANSVSEDPTPALEAHQELASLYVENAEPRKAEAEFQSAIATIENRQAGLTKADYKLSYLSSLVRFYRSYVDFLVQRTEIDKALAVVESSRARILKERLTGATAPAPESARQFQALARSSHRTFLSYWLGPKQSYVWAITPAGIRMFTLPPEKEISALVEAYRTVIEDLRDPLASHNPAGARLSQILLAPVQPFIPAGSHVVVVPDSALHSLNFATLPAPDDPSKYWIEEVTTSVAPSLGLAVSSGSTSKVRGGNLLAIGDPDSPGADYPRLPNARQELNTIAALFSSSDRTLYEGAAAEPSSYLDAKPARFSFIHFAAHAMANRASPLDSALILSRRGNAYELTARDIMKVPLDASLVTLSSCRSAGARAYSGEGLVGLTWAFLQAGARNVIAGLWDVDDESTSRLMVRMYGGLTRGMPPEDALRAAQISLLHGDYPYNKPYYWGPFQLYSRTQP